MGAVANAIDNKLRARFAPQRLIIEDDSSRHRGHAGYREGGESHFSVEIVSAAFEGKNRVARQRLVYETLKDEFAAGLHALQVKALTPGEATGC
ncbi:MAG TPA: BolA family protein [Reyranella sp.]|jgi:BolA protein|nr:BolA family protein [Reyranella sp.]